MTMIAPMALGSFVGPFAGQADASSAPGKVSNPTIDWDTFSHDQITLLWDPSPNATGYIVERNGEVVYDGPNSRFTDTGLVSGAVYQYAIYAYNDYGVSEPIVDYIQTEEVYQSIVIKWLPVTNAVEYLIERNGTIIDAVDADTFSYTDHTALLGNIYRYKVIPVDGEGYIIEDHVKELGEIKPIEGEDPPVLEEQNRAPYSYPIDDIELKVGETKNLNLDNYFFDPNGDVLTYEVEARNSIVSVYTSGVSSNNLTVKGEALGDSTLLITAKDGRGGVTQRTVTVRVVQDGLEPPDERPKDPEPLPNVPPESKMIGNQSIKLGTSKTLDLRNYFHDEDGDTLTFTAKVNNNRVTQTIDGYNLTLSGVEQGVSTVTVTADDGHGHKVSETFNVNVWIDQEQPEPEVPEEPKDEPPVSYNIPDRIIELNETKKIYLKYHFKDPNGDYLSYDVSVNNGNVSANITGEDQKAVLYFTGKAVGQSIVTVTAKDGLGNSVTEQFVVKVTQPFEGGNPEEDEDNGDENKPPIIERSIPNGTIVIGTSKNIYLDNYFDDPDGDKLTYTVHSSNSNVSKSGSGDRLTLEGVRLGETKITVYADDGHGHIISQTFDVLVIPAPKEPPYYKPIGVIYGEDFVEVQWYPILGAAGYNVYLNGNLVYNQPEDGSYYYHYRADGLDPNVENVLVVEPYAEDGTSLGEIEFPIDPDKLASFIVNAEVNGNDVKITWDKGNIDADGYQVAIIDSEGNIVDSKEYRYGSVSEHKALVEKAGNYTAVVTPKVDGEYLDGQAVQFTIASDYEENRDPKLVGELNSITVVLGEEPHVQDIAGVFEDPDGDNLSYEIKLNNTNTSVEMNGTVMTVTPNHVGSTIVTLIVTDGNGGKHEEKFFVYVKEPKNKAPIADVIPDQELDITDEPLVLNALDFFSDEDGDELTVRVGQVTNSNVIVNSDGKNITITPQKVGTTIVRLIATDEHGASVSQQFTVVVNEVAPEGPENLRVEALSYNQVNISFDAVGNADEYIILRNGEEIARTALTSYTDKEVSPETSYTYEVIAVNEVGESDPVSATVTTEGLPTIQNVQATVDGQKITITWDALEGANRYRVQLYKKAANGEFVPEGFARSTSNNSYSYEGLDVGEYKFEIIPRVDGKFSEAQSGSTTATIDESDIVKPEVKTVENIRVTLDGIKANVSFDPLTVDGSEVSRYRIQVYVKNDEGEFVKFGSAKATSDTSNNVFDLVAGKEFKFEVTPRIGYVYDNNYQGSVEVSVPADAAPIEPETDELGEELEKEEIEIRDVIVTDNGDHITVEWTPQGDATAYKVYRYVLTEDGTYKLDRYGQRVEGTTFVDNYNLKGNKEYMYVVVPFENNHYKKSKAVGGVVTTADLEETPVDEGNEAVGSDLVQNVQAVQNGKNVELSWDALVSNGKEVDRYRVQRFKLDNNGNWVKDGYAPTVRGTSYVDKKAQVGVEYKYHIIPQIGFYDESKAGTVEITLSE